MKQMNRLTLSTTLAATLLALLFLGLTGCAHKQTSSPAPSSARDLSPSAQISYDFLLYQDQLQRMQHHMAEGERSTLTSEEIEELHTQAAEALDRLLVAIPSPSLYLEKAGLYWNHPDGTSRSRVILKEGLSKFPNDQMLTIFLANSYIIDDRIDSAIGVMDDYLIKNPDDIQARERLGQMLLDASKDAQALDILKLIPPDKRSADALYSIGRVQGNLGMRRAATASLKKAIAIDSGFTEAMVELAYQYELAKDYVSAEKVYTQILTKNESFPEARLRLININLKLNNPAKALNVALDGPQTKSFILDAVLLFINDGFYAQGSTALGMLTSDGSIPAEYYFYKAVIANEGENDPNTALELLGKVSKKDQLYPHALRFKAQLLNAMGKREEALNIAARGKKLFPDGVIFYILESALLQEKKDFVDAERTLKQGLIRLKNNPELTYELANLYENTQKREQALTLMETVIRAHPDHIYALNYIGYTLAEENRDLDRALVLIMKAARLDPGNGGILDSVAWVYFKKKDYDKAWKNIQYAADIIKTNPIVWEHYGDIAKAMGKKKEARKGYANALKFKSLNPDIIKEKQKDL